MQTALEVTSVRCISCGSSWTHSYLLVRHLFNSFSYPTDHHSPIANPVRLTHRNLTTPVCHHCVDPNLPREWPEWKDDQSPRVKREPTLDELLE